jgi:hypothetical protein
VHDNDHVNRPNHHDDATDDLDDGSGDDDNDSARCERVDVRYHDLVVPVAVGCRRPRR